MKLSLNVFFFGWWLSRQCWISSGQTLPTPLISTNFSGMVVLGKDVTISCKSQDDFHGLFYLTKYTSSSDGGVTAEIKYAVSNQAAFFLSNLSKSQGGMYDCRSCLREKPCSDLSDKIYLNLTDPSLTKPSIQILNAKDRPYFWCEGTEFSLTFALMNSRQQIDFKAAEPAEKRVEFSLNWERLNEAESYTCQYHYKNNPFVWSVPSDPLEFPLRVLDPYLWAGIGVSAFLIVMLLLAVVLYRKRRKSSKTNEHKPAMNLTSNVEEHPDEVSYAILNHQPQETQQATNPKQTSEPCLYASVVKNTGFPPYMP